MRHIFRNTALNNTFLKQGYCVGDFIPTAVLQSLIDFFKNNSLPGTQDFHTTHFSTDKEYKKHVNDGLIQILAPVIDNLLVKHNAAFANFMIKPGGAPHMPLHADWTYVNEPDYGSIALWIPLIDTVPENGCLGVIPYSQHLSLPVRGPRITQVLPPHDALLIKKMGRLIPMKAGQAIFYDHRLLHYSPANQTDIVRPAINISIVPKDIKFIHYTWPIGENNIHKYEVDNFDFFIRYDHFQIPEMGEPVEYIQLHEVPTIHDRIDNFLKKYREGFLQRLKKRFVKS